MPEDPSFIDEHHERIVGFANDFLDEEERDEFVDTMMERSGYQRISNWAPPEGEPKGGKGPVRRRPSTGSGGGKGGQKPGFYRPRS